MENVNSAPFLTVARARAFAQRFNIEALYADFSASFEKEIAEIVLLRDARQSPIPSVSFAQIKDRGFTSDQVNLIRQRGCVIVRGTFSESTAAGWNKNLHDYLEVDNQYHDNLIKDIQSGNDSRKEHQHIHDVFWSKPQIEIRQSIELHVLQQRLNAIWKVADSGAGSFDPDNAFSFADRVRIRKPSDPPKGIPPHVDSFSVESWMSEETIEQAYKALFNGHWQDFEAFVSTHRVNTTAQPHPDTSGVFRTYQGWMALTDQGAQCGSLQLVPSSRCVAWLLLRLLRDGLSTETEMFPKPGEPFTLNENDHGLLTQGLCSIPQVYAGDTVWWHPEVVHSVENVNNNANPSSVVYLGIAPVCERNSQYIKKQKQSFIDGLSPPDFPPVNEERAYVNRAKPEHLSPLGARQMGMENEA